jgi:hypothetical protein
VCRDGFFDTPFDLFKEKKFSSLRRDNEPFWELKRSKIEETASIFRKTVFYKQILVFLLPFQNFMPHIEIMEFCQDQVCTVDLLAGGKTKKEENILQSEQ